MTHLIQYDNKDLNEFQIVCRENEITEGSGKKFFINDTEIAIFKYLGNYYAVNNVCPHQHSPLIYDGILEDGCVVCPAHGWMFDLKTGKLLSGGRGLDTYPVMVANSHIYVKVIGKKFNW